MDRDKLAKTLGMMGSAHDGEVLNAAHVAVRIVKEAGLSWHQAIEADMNGVAVEAARVLHKENEALRDEVKRLCARQPTLPDTWSSPRTVAEAIEQALAWTEVLTDWEREFATSIAGRRHLTVKQRERLEQIIQKIERIARARGLAS